MFVCVSGIALAGNALVQNYFSRAVRDALFTTHEKRFSAITNTTYAIED